jgi:dTDP-glucose 4,6-dehydratase
MKGRTILVTGGAGFVGSNFVRRAVGSGAEVITLDALTYAGDPSNLASLEHNPLHIFVHGSINDRALVSSLLEKHKPQAIVNFAAESHVDRSIDGPDAFIATNINGVFELLEAARAYCNGTAPDGFRFLQISTDEVYGSVAEGLSNENSPLEPNSPYAASKAAADHLVRSYHQTYGLPTLLTRSSNNYGPHQFPEKLIPLMILNAMESKPLPIYGDGTQIRDWIHVDDNCAAIEAVLERGEPGQTYNIGGGSGVRNIDIAHRLCTTLDRLYPASKPYESLITHVEDRPGHDRRYALDSTRIAEALNWQAKNQLEDGIEQTVLWYLENEAWWQRIRAKQYAGERLGLASRANGQRSNGT